MQIQNVNSLYQSKLNPLYNRRSISSAQKLSQDCFVPSFSADKDVVQNVLDSVDKFDVPTYKSMSLKEKALMRLSTDAHIKKAAKETIKMANILKKELDKKYGKNNYVFVSIGTSPACIGRVFEFSGIETKYLPISDMRENTATNEYISENKEGVEAYKEFLTSQGITKERLDNPDKHILFYDYTSKGTTLRKYKYMLQEVFDLPTNSDKVEFRSLNKDYYNIASNKVFSNLNQMGDYISHYLAGEYSFVYGGIPHLNYARLEKIKDVVENKIQDNDDFNVLTIIDCGRYYRNMETEKRFSFMVMSELEKRGHLKHNPANEKAL